MVQSKRFGALVAAFVACSYACAIWTGRARRSSCRVCSAVDVNGLASDLSCVRTGKEERKPRDVLGGSRALRMCGGDELIPSCVAECAGEEVRVLEGRLATVFEWVMLMS